MHRVARMHRVEHIIAYDRMAALRIAYVYWKILGLCPWVFSNSGVVRLSYPGLIYAIIISVTYTVCYIRAVENRVTFSLSRESPMSIVADFGGLSIEFGVIVLSWLCFGFRHKKVKKIVTHFKKIHESYETLGIRENNARIFRDVKIHTIVINFIWYLVCVADHLLLINCGVFDLKIWLPFNVPRVVTHNIMVIFADTMKAIQQRFRSLNKRIKQLPTEVPTRITVRNCSQEISNNSDGLKSFATPGPLEIYGQLHSDLIDLAKSVVNFFSISILLIMLTQCIQMSSGLYTLCLVAKDRKFWPWRDIGSFVVLCTWFIIHFSEMALLVSVSDSTAREANRTGNVLHEMLLEKRTGKYINSAKIMSLRLLQRHLKIELFGLFQMRLEIIYRIMGMVATYITIMIQLDDQREMGK